MNSDYLSRPDKWIVPYEMIEAYRRGNSVEFDAPPVKHLRDFTTDEITAELRRRLEALQSRIGQNAEQIILDRQEIAKLRKILGE